MSETDTFVPDLLEQIYAAIAHGSKSIILCGVNTASIKIMATLQAGALISYVTGIIDNSRELQGASFFGYEVQLFNALPTLQMDTLVITDDAGKETILERIAQLDGRLPLILYSGDKNYLFDDAALSEIVKSCPVKSKAGGYPNMLVHLYQALSYVAERKLPGEVTEFGVYQGGTTVIMAKILRHVGYPVKIYGFDTFAGFPARKSMLDNYNDRKCEFPDYQTVRDYCAPYNIELIPGDICDTYTRLRGIPLALSFFDTDNYSATRRALQMCWDQTVDGGVLAFDHYYSPGWNKTIGERIAIREVLGDKRAFNLHGTGIFLKI
jgi:O-methyltransferase